MRSLALNRAGLARALVAGAARADGGGAQRAARADPSGSWRRVPALLGRELAGDGARAGGARTPRSRPTPGTGIDDPTATIRADQSPLGFHASIRGSHGTWYVEPASHADQTTYVSYFGRNLRNMHGSFVEREAASLSGQLAGPDLAGAQRRASATSCARTGSR